MRRITLLISGNVQKAGYRDLVIRFGTALGLRGYAENVPDGSVKVVAEGDEQKLELLKISERGETDERLDKAAELLKELIGAVQSGFKETVTSINSVKGQVLLI